MATSVYLIYTLPSNPYLTIHHTREIQHDRFSVGIVHQGVFHTLNNLHLLHSQLNGANGEVTGTDDFDAAAFVRRAREAYNHHFQAPLAEGLRRADPDDREERPAGIPRNRPAPEPVDENESDDEDNMFDLPEGANIYEDEHGIRRVARDPTLGQQRYLRNRYGYLIPTHDEYPLEDGVTHSEFFRHNSRARDAGRIERTRRLPYFFRDEVDPTFDYSPLYRLLFYTLVVVSATWAGWPIVSVAIDFYLAALWNTFGVDPMGTVKLICIPLVPSLYYLQLLNQALNPQELPLLTPDMARVCVPDHVPDLAIACWYTRNSFNSKCDVLVHMAVMNYLLRQYSGPLPSVTCEKNAQNAVMKLPAFRHIPQGILEDTVKIGFQILNIREFAKKYGQCTTVTDRVPSYSYK